MKKGENTLVHFESNHRSIHTVYNYGEMWTSVVFTSLFLKGCISGCRSPNEMGVKSNVFRNNHPLRVSNYYCCLDLFMIYFIHVSFFWYTLYRDSGLILSLLISHCLYLNLFVSCLFMVLFVSCLFMVYCNLKKSIKTNLYIPEFAEVLTFILLLRQHLFR